MIKNTQNEKYDIRKALQSPQIFKTQEDIHDKCKGKKIFDYSDETWLWLSGFQMTVRSEHVKLVQSVGK